MLTSGWPIGEVLSPDTDQTTRGTDVEMLLDEQQGAGQSDRLVKPGHGLVQRPGPKEWADPMPFQYFQVRNDWLP